MSDSQIVKRVLVDTTSCNSLVFEVPYHISQTTISSIQSSFSNGSLAYAFELLCDVGGRLVIRKGVNVEKFDR